MNTLRRLTIFTFSAGLMVSLFFVSAPRSVQALEPELYCNSWSMTGGTNNGNGTFNGSAVWSGGQFGVNGLRMVVTGGGQTFNVPNGSGGVNGARYGVPYTAYVEASEVGGGGSTLSDDCDNTVIVNPPSSPPGTRSTASNLTIYDNPTVVLNASSPTINAGQSLNLTWSTHGTALGNTCTVSTNPGYSWSGQWTGQKAGAGGTQSIGPFNQAGTYGFLIQCAGPLGTSSNTASTVISVNTPTYTAVCSPSTQTIVRGSSASVQITTNPVNGFNSAVTFSATVYPSSGTPPTTSFTNNGQVPPAVTNGIITTNGTTTPNTYIITFTGTGGGVSQQCTAEVVVEPQPLPTVDIQCNGTDGCSVAVGGTVNVSWTSSDATSCSVTSSPAGFNGSGISNGGTPSQPLNANTTFTASCTGPGGTSQDSVLATVVGPPPDFGISCTPPTQSVSQGSSASFSLSTTAQNGFSSPVTWSVQPGGISPGTANPPTVSFTNNGQVPPATTTGIVNTTATTTPASYTITFTGLGSGIVHTCQVNFVVSSVPVNPPTNVTASNTGTCGTITLNWAWSGTSLSGFRVYRKANPADPYVQVGGDLPSGNRSYTDTAPLNPAGSNYYTVAAFFGATESTRADAFPAPIVPQSCAPSISNADKDVTAANGNPSSGTAPVPCSGVSEAFTLPNNALFKVGDVVTFRICIQNSGTADVTGMSITDTLTNVTNPTGLTFSPVGCRKGSPAVTPTGFTANLNDLAPSSSCVITFTATVTAPSDPTAIPPFRFLNHALVTADGGITRNLYTLPYLFTNAGGVPTREEIAP